MSNDKIKIHLIRPRNLLSYTVTERELITNITTAALTTSYELECFSIDFGIIPYEGRYINGYYHTLRCVLMADQKERIREYGVKDHSWIIVSDIRGIRNIHGLTQGLVLDNGDHQPNSNYISLEFKSDLYFIEPKKPTYLLKSAIID